jgi:hypothetical protein
MRGLERMQKLCFLEEVVDSVERNFPFGSYFVGTVWMIEKVVDAPLTSAPSVEFAA